MPVLIKPMTRSRCMALTSGPSLLASFRLGPTLNLAIAAWASALTSSYRAAGTSMRVWAEQVWPLFSMQAPTVPLTAASKLALSKITLADLPPSSSAIRLTDWLASSLTRLPARVEPVKLTMSTSGWVASTSPTTGPMPLTRLNTPGGMPAS